MWRDWNRCSCYGMDMKAGPLSNYREVDCGQKPI